MNVKNGKYAYIQEIGSMHGWGRKEGIVVNVTPHARKMKPRTTREMTPARRQPRVFSSYDSRCTEQSSIVIFFLLIFVLVSRYDDTPGEKKKKKKSIVDSRARARAISCETSMNIHTHTRVREFVQVYLPYRCIIIRSNVSWRFI